MSDTPDVLVVGAGIVGAAVAWRCAQRGLAVTTVDPDPDRGAWHTAAGMLAPVSELEYTETPLLRLNVDSLARWPAFAAELEAASGRHIGFRETGTVTVASDAADLATLRDHDTLSRQLGLASSLITSRELRSLEPALAAGLPGGWHAPDDHQVDPRLVHAALRCAADAAGVTSVEGTVMALTRDTGPVTGVELADGTRLAAGVVVLAAGAWSAGLDSVPVRPVKGQTLRLRLPGPPRLDHVVRGRVRGNPVYLVPRADGRIVVGASSEEAGFDVTPRAGAVYELLRDAQALLPELEEAELEQVCTGLRPATPDNAPSIGFAVPGLVHATGHFRNGVLQTPVTADAVAAIVTEGADVPEVVAAFSPGRFPAGSRFGPGNRLPAGKATAVVGR